MLKFANTPGCPFHHWKAAAETSFRRQYSASVTGTTESTTQEPSDDKARKTEQLRKDFAAREAGMTDEQRSGITKSRRRRLIKQTQKTILADPGGGACIGQRAQGETLTVLTGE
jgi:hypothetical protein